MVNVVLLGTFLFCQVLSVDIRRGEKYAVKKYFEKPSRSFRKIAPRYYGAIVEPGLKLVRFLMGKYGMPETSSYYSYYMFSVLRGPKMEIF